MSRLVLFLALAGCPKPAPVPEAAPAAAPEAASADAVLGDWKGHLELPGLKLRLALHVQGEGDALTATMDSPDQGANGIPASGVTWSDGELRVDMDSLGAVYEAKVEQDQLVGTFAQRGAKLPLTLERGIFAAVSRPQEPAEPLPYGEEAVSIAVAAGHTLAGTLTVPEGEGPFPAVVLVSGSGPQDRDEALLGHRPFYVLADRLTRAGVAVLRYDDRGVGASTGKFDAATTLDFADDARTALAWLDAREDTARVGVVGHSEGGMIAPMVTEADFLVLLAAPAVPSVDLMLRQQEDVARSMGVPEGQATANRDARRRMLELVANSNDPAAVEELRTVMASMPESKGVPEAQLEQAMQSMLTPWWRVFAGYDPAENLGAIHVPTLAVWGSLDTQVAAEPNHEAMTALVGEEWLTARIYEDLNHLFQPATTGSPQEYGQIETTFSEQVMADIAAFALSPG
ncbi:MAG: alpha/beta fold hydrolase [Deltaproteobacteria bacterium]|nr:MAG: alpha/beta fold hydrolase [Deltaproteobacteria bacterium]